MPTVLCLGTKAYLSVVERSEQNISLDNIYKISRALKVSAAELLECSPQ